MFFNEIAEVNALHLETHGISANAYKPLISNECDEDEFNALIDENRDDLLDQCEYFDLAEIICSENDLQETDLLPRLIVAIQSWNEKQETAHEAMKSVTRLIYLAIDQVAEKEAKKAMGL